MTDGPNHLDQQEWAALDPDRPLPPPMTDDERAAALARIREDRMARMTPPARDLAWAVEWAERQAAIHEPRRGLWVTEDGNDAEADAADALRLLLGAAEDAGRWRAMFPRREPVCECGATWLSMDGEGDDATLSCEGCGRVIDAARAAGAGQGEP